eukprot:CAMPEP_0206278652 /NCGR_PEP_ID=MMETSP0047_2-20121206/37539_1 /ASSEMBLY_ACC=CAM_ASM_000192 /TAXON_ID=195065 /ORGANISM="Chroomonas mesostigmatica_cf, Strain CCMP1168" /LENGTH=606 /DNA_ID=CAMNT_0053708421 /DNA_START=110 /DNA_END=1931 /DNA_ORIENTATION=+
MGMRRLLPFLAVLAAAHGYPGWFAKEHKELNPLDRVQPRKLEVLKPQFPWGTLSVSPDVLEEGGAYLTVSWRTLLPHKDPYWIGMYLEGEDPASIVPIKYMFTKSDAEKHFSEAGSASFWATNMRKGIVFNLFRAIVFNLFRGQPEAPTLVATSNTVKLRTPNEPTGGRLTHSAMPGSMTISWITGPGATNQTVQWGSVAGQYTQSADALATTYARSDMCGGVAKGQGWREPGIHYRYGSDADGWSLPFFFYAKPAYGAKAKFFVFGDLGTHSPDESEQEWDAAASRNTTDLMAAESFGKSLALHVGDISYAVGYASKWDDFHAQIAPIATRMPYMTAIGNHERDWPGSAIGVKDSGGECGVPYDFRFTMPGTERDMPWYSFDHGPVHFCVISTEHDLDDQYAFVLKDLATVNRTKTPWVVFAAHRPLYVSSTNSNPIDGDQTAATQLREVFEELLYIAEVDVVVTGHHHTYQRTCPVYKGACTTPRFNFSYAGPVHVVVGMAGFATTTNVEDPQPDIFEYVDAEHHGYARVSADPTSFTLEYVVNDDGAVHDVLALKKVADPPSPYAKRAERELLVCVVNDDCAVHDVLTLKKVADPPSPYAKRA